MVEIAGVIASGIAVGQLETQIITCCEKLYKFCNNVKAAQKRVTFLLEEISVLSRILEQSPHNVNDPATEAQLLVQNTMLELRDFLGNLERGMKRDDRRSKLGWGRIKAVSRK